ncbi:MAG: proline dehydrogenase family protein, partial [bacterium]
LMPFVPRFMVWKVASRYIAGTTLEEAIATVKKLNQEDAWGIIDLLGEGIEEAHQAQSAAKMYHQILDRITKERIYAYISLKPTQFGLKISYDLCYNLISELVDHAGKVGNFVRLDMEDHTCTDDTLRLYKDLRRHYENVGVVIQAYLRRSIYDIQMLKEMRSNVRLCKGIYNEPSEIAYKNRAIIIRNFAFLLEELLSAGCYVGIATHCEEVIWHAERLIFQMKLKPHQYEFQMLLGVEPQLRRVLLERGHHLRVYVAFGKDWFPYSSRRLKENPHIAQYVMRSFLGLKSSSQVR